MKSRILLLLLTLSTFLLTGCQNNNLAAENEALKQQITKLEQQITELEQNNTNASNENNPAAETVSQNNANTQNTNSSQTNGNTQNTGNNSSSTTTYTMEELSAMVDEFAASVGSATPDVNNSGNLDQFFSLKREADQIEHALENHENYLEDQYRAGTLSREEYRKLDKEIELLEDTLDTAKDRLEITFGIDD